MKKNNKTFGFVVLIGLTVLGGASAFADVPPSTSATTLPKSTYDKIADKVAFTYFGIYHGGPVNGLTNDYQPQENGLADPTSAQNLESYVTTGYKINKDLMVGLSSHFFYNASSIEVSNGGTVKAFQYLNPALMVSKANMIDNGNGFKLKGLFYAQLPLTQYDYISAPGHNMLTALSPTVVANWDVPKTKLTLGVYSMLTAYIAGPNSPDGLRTYKFYAAPYGNYQFAKTVAATVWIDAIQATRNQGTGFISGATNPDMDIEPGFNWDISPKFSINPILNIYPANPTLAATSLQAIIVGKVF